MEDVVVNYTHRLESKCDPLNVLDRKNLEVEIELNLEVSKMCLVRPEESLARQVD